MEHLPVIGRCAKKLCVKGYDCGGIDANGVGEVTGRNFWSLWRSNHIENNFWLGIIWATYPHDIQKVLAITQVCKIR